MLDHYDHEQPNSCIISAYCVSIVFPPCSHSPSTGPPRIPILVRLFKPPLPLGLPISAPHQPYLFQSSFDSLNPHPSHSLIIPPPECDIRTHPSLISCLLNKKIKLAFDLLNLHNKSSIKRFICLIQIIQH